MIINNTFEFLLCVKPNLTILILIWHLGKASALLNLTNPAKCWGELKIQIF